MIKSIFGKIWLIWSAIWFGLSMPFMWIAYQIAKLFTNDENKYKTFFSITKVWGHLVLFFLGVRVKTYSKEKNAEDEQVIYISNHVSQIDIPINFTTTPQFVILSKEQAAKLPAVGISLRLGHVTVDRKNKESRINSVKKLKEHLNAGRSLLLYPEGSRNRKESAVGDFQDGAFTLANEFNIPIVPVVIVGSGKINNPSNPLALYPGKIEVHFLDKIFGKEFNSITEFKNFTRDKMADQINH